MFWVMTFQDILHMIPSRVSSQTLRRIANHHKMEDRGHDKWFLEDLDYIYRNHKFDVAWIYSDENRNIREITYGILSEVFTPSDPQKVALILVLESTGHIFFENVAQFVKNNGYSSKLKYFSHTHLEVEKNHAVFEEALNRHLFSIDLSSQERESVLAMVNRVYDGFHSMFDNLLISYENNRVNSDQLLKKAG